MNGERWTVNGERWTVNGEHLLAADAPSKSILPLVVWLGGIGRIAVGTSGAAWLSSCCALAHAALAAVAGTCRFPRVLTFTVDGLLGHFAAIAQSVCGDGRRLCDAYEAIAPEADDRTSDAGTLKQSDAGRVMKSKLAQSRVGVCQGGSPSG